jgi:hypothetical protein
VKPKGSTQADSLIRTLRAYFIEARGATLPQQQAGYMSATLSLPLPTQYLANREETIYGLRKLSTNLHSMRYFNHIMVK